MTNRLSVNITSEQSKKIVEEMERRGESVNSIVARALNLYFVFDRFLSSPRYEVTVRDKLTGRKQTYFIEDDK